MNDLMNPYHGHRYPTEIISHAVWLYFRFALSFRDVSIENSLEVRLALATEQAVLSYWIFNSNNVIHVQI